MIDKSDYLRINFPNSNINNNGNNYNKSVGSTKREMAKSQMESWFKTHPSYFQMKYDKDGLIYDAIIEDEKSLKSVTSWRRLYSLKLLHLGDYIEVVDDEMFKDVKWLVVKNDHYNGVYNRHEIRECNRLLKYYNKSGKLVEKWCVYESKNPYNEGQKNFPEIILGANQRALVLPDDEDTKIIRRGFDFIFDGLAYKVSSYDSETEPNLLYLICTEYQKGEGDIDIPSSNKYVFTIDLQENSLELKVGDTKQLNVIVKRDSDIVKRDIIYKSSDETIATVDVNGLITCVKNGNVIITVMLKDNDTVKDECKLVVIDVPTPQNIVSYDFDVNSKNFVIGFGIEKAFYFDKYENGNKTNYGSFAYELDYNGKDSKIASITNHESNKVVIKTNNKMISGKIYLIVKDTLNGNNIVMRQELNIKWV